MMLDVYYKRLSLFYLALNTTVGYVMSIEIINQFVIRLTVGQLSYCCIIAIHIMLVLLVFIIRFASISLRIYLVYHCLYLYNFI